MIAAGRTLSPTSPASEKVRCTTDAITPSPALMILKGKPSQPLRFRCLAAGAVCCGAGAVGADPAAGAAIRAPGRGGMGCASAGWLSVAGARNQL